MELVLKTSEQKCFVGSNPTASANVEQTKIPTEKSIRRKRSLLRTFRNWLASLPTVAILLPIQGLSIFAWWVAGSYFKLDVYSSRIFPGEDGWCNSPVEGLGVHCWGDYYYPLYLLSQEDPFSGELVNPYPAAALSPFMIFQAITQFSGIPGLGLLTYLMLMTLTIVYSVWFATKGQSLENRVFLFSTLVFFTPAVLAVIDRGNSTGFLVSLLIWLFHSLRSAKHNQTVWALALMSVVKPHFGLLTLALVLGGKPRLGLQGMLLGIFLNLFSFFALWPRTFPGNLWSWFTGFLGFQDYGSVAAPWPQNISFSQSIYSLFYGIDLIAAGSLHTTLTLIESYQSLWGPLILILVYLLIALRWKNMSTGQMLVLATSAISMTSAISYYYYIVLSIPFILMLTSESRENQKPAEVVDRSVLGVNFFLWSASALTLVQAPIPGLVYGDKILGSGVLVGGFWIVSYILIAFKLFRKNNLLRPAPTKK
jgi:hypothetical protein